jgi:hypothetical protein
VLIFYGAGIIGSRLCKTLPVKGECTNHPPLPASFWTTGDPGLGRDSSQDKFRPSITLSRFVSNDVNKNPPIYRLPVYLSNGYGVMTGLIDHG